MTAKTFRAIFKTEAILYCRGFFGPFFSFAFPVMMIFLFGNIFGNDPSPFFNGQGSMDVSIPAYLGMVIAVSAIMSLPLQLAEYQGNNVYKRFDVAPIGKGNIIAVQMTLYFIAATLGSLLLIILGKLFYNIHIGGSFGVIIPVFLLSLVSMFSIGFFIASVFKSTKMINLISYLLYFLMLFISGATFPAELLPDNVRAFAKILPLTHVVDLLKHSFAGKWGQEDFISVVVLAAIACVCISIGALFYRRRRWA